MMEVTMAPGWWWVGVIRMEVTMAPDWWWVGEIRMDWHWGGSRAKSSERSWEVDSVRWKAMGFDSVRRRAMGSAMPKEISSGCW